VPNPDAAQFRRKHCADRTVCIAGTGTPGGSFVVQETVGKDNVGRSCFSRRMTVPGNQYIVGNKKMKVISQYPVLYRQHSRMGGQGRYRAFPVFVIFFDGLMGDGGFVWAGSSSPWGWEWASWRAVGVVVSGWGWWAACGYGWLIG
jgi:hypothetical protein